jgi:hypothetical protein
MLFSPKMPSAIGEGHFGRKKHVGSYGECLIVVGAKNSCRQTTDPKTAKSASQAPAFVKLTPVGPEPTPSAIELVLGDRRVLRIRPGFDADVLLELVRVLEEPSC